MNPGEANVASTGPATVAKISMSMVFMALEPTAIY